MSQSSLFILHRDFKIRQFLLAMTTSPDLIVVKERAISKPEEYGISNILKSVKYSLIEFNNGIILGTKRHKLISQIFEGVIIWCILLSSISLCILTPLSDPEAPLSRILIVTDILFTFIFFIEASLKILASGFLYTSYSGTVPYIRNGWNVLDFIVVILSIFDFYFEIQNTGGNTDSLGSLKALRAIRTLRPLRMISRSEGLKVAVQALMSSIPSMRNVLMLCLLFLLIFAILGVNVFKGTFYYWDTEFTDLLPQVNDRHDWLDAGGDWTNKDANFDNVPNAMIALFEIMTTEGWYEIMISGIDSRGIGLQPKYNHRVLLSIYFLFFVLIGSLIMINLFTATIVDNFNKIKERQEIGYGLIVTKSQKNWIEVQTIWLRK